MPSAGRAAGCLALFGLWIAAGAEAQKQILAGTQYRGWRVAAFDVRGVPRDLGSSLVDGLALAGDWKIFWTERPPFSPDKLQQDIERSLLYLARNGYPWAHITPHLEPDAAKHNVRVQLDVEPGPAVVVAENRIEAIPPDLEPKAREILTLDPGERFSDARVERRVRQLLAILQESGRAHAEVKTAVQLQDSTHALVQFRVSAGPVYWFRWTRVTGVEPDLIGVVIRTVDIDRGTRYSPEPLRRAANNLRALDLFRLVQVDTEPATGDTLDVTCNLAQVRPRSVEAGIGYWSQDQIRLSAEWKHRNLLREGRGGGVSASYSRFLQTAGVSLWRPTLFGSRTYGTLSLRFRRESEPNYLLLGTELEAAASYLYSSSTRLRPALSLSRLDVRPKNLTPIPFDNPGHNLVVLSFTGTRDVLDDPLFPTSGTYATLDVEEGLPGLDPTRLYWRAAPDGVYYKPIGERLTLVSRLRVGMAGPAHSALDLLPNKRFYAGGAGSMRGYRRHELGPLDPAGRPLGGLASLESTVEVRFPIWRSLGGSAFVDAGQVWLRRDQIRLSDLRYATGPGLVLRTPIGPIRADFGIRLGRSEVPQPRTVFHLSVGHTF